ncbi:conserved exported protein of unknown function [Tenacibaculum sp. 190130A14a]|uniref:Lipoprotein n=1 Tax=Tenacibaculum polynesiense TaxID=3137857 RepID=A0ABM9PCA3_9FLAO
MRTLKTILIMSMLMVLATSCTDLTEDLVPNTKENTELVTSRSNEPGNGDPTDTTDNGDPNTNNDGSTGSEDTGGSGDGDGGTGKGE